MLHDRRDLRRVEAAHRDTVFDRDHAVLLPTALLWTNDRASTAAAM
jgi:hypothetical protein